MHVAYTDEMKKRSEDIMEIPKIRTFNGSHIAAAESANTDVSFMTDSKMGNMASKLELKVKVRDPLQFAREVFQMLDADLNSPADVGNARVKVLREALGSMGMVKFIRQFDLDYGSYTEEKYERPDISLDETDAILKR